MAQLVHSPQQMVIVPAGAAHGMKDSKWLTLEVCREFQRSKCSRSDTECKFAHPPPHVEVQNGRVVACFDSIKGKCQRKEPLCKYLHPPQHLREQLLQNGRNNLILKNLQLQAYHQQAQYISVMPVAYETGAKTAVAMPAPMPGHYSYLTHYPGLQALPAATAQVPAAAYNPYLTSYALPTTADQMSVIQPQLQPAVISTKTLRAEKFETTTDTSDPVTTPVSLVDSFSYSTYITQATSSTAMPHHMVLGKKRPRDPVDDYLLQSTIPGLVPAYKRIAVGDISKGAFPVYQTNPLMSQLQPTSMMSLQQHPSYIPVTFAGHPPSMPRL